MKRKKKNRTIWWRMALAVQRWGAVDSPKGEIESFSVSSFGKKRKIEFVVEGKTYVFVLERIRDLVTAMAFFLLNTKATIQNPISVARDSDSLFIKFDDPVFQREDKAAFTVETGKFRAHFIDFHTVQIISSAKNALSSLPGAVTSNPRKFAIGCLYDAIVKRAREPNKTTDFVEMARCGSELCEASKNGDLEYVDKNMNENRGKGYFFEAFLALCQDGDFNKNFGNYAKIVSKFVKSREVGTEELTYGINLVSERGGSYFFERF